ncbi:dihydroneopterin aldolase [Fontimonas thermophila]|uniref:7,8-dihydroneopterin aldolase n=1 Tax=Fontimonas thermophila TaxID=1076937 RepID=A0A1I2GXW4_9GAMM|nr:dihydroneopterin aldolase [Fontimonas thermophila]SFF22262.1 dihydroneopterin aldolase [Fontimonas thermophila]
MDKIFIRGLTLEAVIGVHAWERRLKRPLVFDLELGVDARAAASSDRVRDAVDYTAVSAHLRRLLDEQQPALLETLAERIARALFAEFAIQTLRLAIDKPGAVEGAKQVGVVIERRREDYAACGR